MADFFMMPAASPTMEVGRLASWIAAEGDTLEFGTVVAEVETDKATAEIECFEDGVLLKILQPAGADVAVGTPIAIVGEEGDDISELLAQFESGSVSATPAVQEAAPQTQPIQEATGPVKAGPGARVQADASGVSLSSVKGTGPNGRVLSSDIPTKSTGSAQTEKYTWHGQSLHTSIMEMPVSFTPSKAYPKRRSTGASSTTQATESDTVVTNSTMRKVIASRLKESYLDAPTFFLNARLNCDNLVAFRNQMKAAGQKVSYNDLVIKAVAKALKDVPGVNASWTDEAIIQHGRVDIGMAVALPDGLITPVIRDADKQSLVSLASQTRELAGRAKDRKLSAEEYSNSTFTISNLGMMQIEHFTAIINPPNAAILAIGSMQQEPVVVDGSLTVGWRMKITMTCDHRVIDGALGAEFLQAVRRYIEFPALLA
jgi:pyruvate dehydrogenase E2 component (dihydrolipoamide acetyltransferase)